ncbi:MAG: FKBP-type peptidyl-prolyl cis-trans isomerase [Bacteroidales bacterium]|jgi:FKBP-type peptidyl-prolyl cis-trans isomerase FklB|nr:FKBP-type peptidyl-prolyl cis-trans isomerase [Bacteroidales bacterium]
MKFRFIGIALFLAFSAIISAQKNTSVNLKNGTDSLSYALGIMFGQNIKSGGFEVINTEVFAKTIDKILRNEPLQMTPEDANLIVNIQFQKIQQLKYQKNLKDGRDFLAANKSNPGVVTLPSGLQYKILIEGSGPKPKATDKVTVHYHGTLIDGTIFDSSVEKNMPIELIVNHVIPGWIEALQLMPVGSKWVLYIPSELAYGENPRPGGPIEPNSALIFEVELISINN